MTEELLNVSIEPANEEDIKNTIKVMGGEDWQLWTDALINADMLSKNAINIAYSYIGPEMTKAVYRDGTIGKAKDDLEKRLMIWIKNARENKRACLCFG